MARRRGVWTTVGSENMHVVPVADTVAHEVSTRCVCGPKWKAQWCENCGGVHWLFVHHSADGREEIAPYLR